VSLCQGHPKSFRVPWPMTRIEGSGLICHQPIRISVADSPGRVGLPSKGGELKGAMLEFFEVDEFWSLHAGVPPDFNQFWRFEEVPRCLQ